MKKLSVALAVFNEEKYLKMCLLAIQGIADEIVIVDGGSSDKTLDIAESFQAKIVKTNNPANFHINKQKALEACEGEWILQLDADEEVSGELAVEICEAISNPEGHSINPQKKRLFERHQLLVETRDHIERPNSGEISAFYVPRRNFFLGKAMTYSGMYPDGVIRLVKNGRARFPAKSVHEQIEITGRVSWLSHDLYHYSNPTLERYMAGAQKYTTLLSKEIVAEKKGMIPLFFTYGIIKPAQTFVNLYIMHKGVLDGFHGFVFCLFSSLHYPVAFWKYCMKILNP